jgi:bifunctional lysine-specific demethylase and histidyl-hydroxylase NO66
MPEPYRYPAAALARLVAPIPRGQFIETYWEQRPLWIPRPLPRWCKQLPLAANLDDLLLHSTAKDVRIVRTQHGTLGEADVVQTGDGRVNMAAVYRAYHDGWTIIINAVDGKVPGISRLAAELSESISHKVGINLYFTPPHAQGFALHMDGHDVFILQLSGRKRWRVLPPAVALPLEEQEAPRLDRAGPPLITATLEAGHILYIPRGFSHESATASGASLHLTIGIHAIRWIDLIQEAVLAAAEREVALRRSLSIPDLQTGKCAAELSRVMSSVSTALADPEIANVACKRVGRKAVHASGAAPDGHFSAIDRARSIHLQSVVEKRQGVRCHVRRQGRRAVIEFGKNKIDGPASIEEALGFIATARRFKVSELPNSLTNGSKLLLVHRLVLEGLLTIRP